MEKGGQMIYYLPGEAIALMTFPGVIVHELAHHIACDILNVPVYYTKYFHLWNKRAGFVLHKNTKKLSDNVWIAFAPLILNTFIGVILLFPFFSVKALGTDFITSSASNLYYFTTWLGFSILFNSIPSNQDVENIRLERSPIMAKLFLGIPILFVKLLNVNYIGGLLTIGYCGLIGILLPSIIFKVVNVNIVAFIPFL